MSVYLQQLVQFSQKIDNLTCLNKICFSASDSLSKSLKVPDNVIYLKVTENRYRQIAASGEKRLSQDCIHSPITLETGQGVVGSTVQTRRSTRVSDTRKINNYIVDDDNRLSELAVPIIYQGEVLGVIDTEHPQLNFFTLEHQLFFEGASAILAPRIASINAQQKLKSSIYFFQKQLELSYFPELVEKESRYPKKLSCTTPNNMIDEANENTNFIDKEDFQQSAKKLLKKYYLAKTWSETSLINTAICSEYQQPVKKQQVLKEAIQLIIQDMEKATPTSLLASIIQQRFIKQQKPQLVLADEMNMGFSTFRRYQSKAIEHFLTNLWLHEESLRSFK